MHPEQAPGDAELLVRGMRGRSVSAGVSTSKKEVYSSACALNTHERRTSKRTDWSPDMHKTKVYHGLRYTRVPGARAPGTPWQSECTPSNAKLRMGRHAPKHCLGRVVGLQRGAVLLRLRSGTTCPKDPLSNNTGMNIATCKHLARLGT